MAGRRLALLPTEEILVDVRPHWSFLSGPLAVAALTIAAGVVLDVAIPHTSVPVHWVEGLVVAVPCAWLGVRLVRWQATALVLTSVRIVERWGVVWRRQSEIRLAQIEHVTVSQSLVRRLVGTGRIEVAVRGLEELAWIDDVRKPVIMQRLINRRLRPVHDAGYGRDR